MISYNFTPSSPRWKALAATVKGVDMIDAARAVAAKTGDAALAADADAAETLAIACGRHVGRDAVLTSSGAILTPPSAKDPVPWSDFAVALADIGRAAQAARWIGAVTDVFGRASPLRRRTAVSACLWCFARRLPPAVGSLTRTADVARWAAEAFIPGLSVDLPAGHALRIAAAIDAGMLEPGLTPESRHHLRDLLLAFDRIPQPEDGAAAFDAAARAA